jgi:hypothetical protein
MAGIRGTYAGQLPFRHPQYRTGVKLSSSWRRDGQGSVFPSSGR